MIYHFKKTIILFFLLLSIGFRANAQYLIGVGAHYDDSFREWNLTTDDEAFEGSLKQRWQMQNNWLEWDLVWGDENGAVKQKWNNDPNQWELRLNGEIVTMKTHWNNDFNEWLISDGRHELILETRYTGQPDEWLVKKNNYGTFSVSMYYENDARDWVVKDNLNDDISNAMRLAMAFTVVYQSSPKK